MPNISDTKFRIHVLSCGQNQSAIFFSRKEAFVLLKTAFAQTHFGVGSTAGTVHFNQHYNQARKISSVLNLIEDAFIFKQVQLTLAFVQ